MGIPALRKLLLGFQIMLFDFICFNHFDDQQRQILSVLLFQILCQIIQHRNTWNGVDEQAGLWKGGVEGCKLSNRLRPGHEFHTVELAL